MSGLFAELEPEHRLLLDCSRPRISDEARARIAESLDLVDWRLVVETAEAHGVTALVLKRLETMELELPGEFAEAGRSYLKRQAERSAVLVANLKAVLRALDQGGIEAIPFKGPMAAQLAYGDLAIRRYRDLDVLVRERDAAAACRIVGELGFRNSDAFTEGQQAAVRRYAGQDIFFRNGIAIEPHWALAPRTLGLDIDHEALFARSRHVELDGAEMRCLSDEDHVLVLALHGSKEEWTRLLWIADLAHMIAARPSLNWECLLGRARAQGCLRMVLTGLILAAELIGSLPPVVKQAIAADPVARDLAETAAARLFDAERAEPSIYRLSAFRWHMRERPADRLRYLLRTVLTPRDIHFSIVRLPDPLIFLYTPLKLVHDYALLPAWKARKRFGGKPSA